MGLPVDQAVPVDPALLPVDPVVLRARVVQVPQVVRMGRAGLAGRMVPVDPAYRPVVRERLVATVDRALPVGPVDPAPRPVAPAVSGVPVAPVLRVLREGPAARMVPAGLADPALRPVDPVP